MGRAGTGTKTNAYKSDTGKTPDMAAFEEILRIAEARAHGETTKRGRGEETRRDVGCRIKTLPRRLRPEASRFAARMNPANMPVLEGIELPPGVDRPMFLTLAVSKYWGAPPREFTVSFMESAPADLRARIVEHMNAWSSRISKTFVETSGVGEVRISLGAGGYYSYLGTDVALIPQDVQTMNLEGFSMNTSESEYRRVVRHETGHTLGFPHEHMRAELVDRIDPEKAYTYFWETQGWDQATVDDQVLTPLDEADIYGTPPDEDSIMCYQLPGEITYDGLPIRGGMDINETDYAFAAEIYPPVSFSPGKRRGKARAADEDDWGPSRDVKLKY